MFQIRDVSGMQRPYVAGTVRSGRQLAPATAIESVHASNEEHPIESAQAAAVHEHYGSPNSQTEPREVTFAREIMTSPVTAVPVTTPMSEVNRLFTARRFRHLPVLSIEQQLVGIISDRDALKFNVHALEQDSAPGDVPVSTVMVTGILTATPDTLIRDVARTMFVERIGSIPILDEGSALVGIITRSDIIRTLLRHGPIRLWA